MTNVNNTSGKSDGRMSRYEVENYTGFKVFIVLLLLAIVVLVSLFANIKASHAASMDERSNACRTYHVFAHQKQDDKYAETDGLFCGATSTTVTVKHSNKDIPTTVAQDNTRVTLDLPTVDNTPVVDDDTASTDTPVVSAPTHGNPGNDKAVGNAGEKCDKGMCENAGGQSGEHGNSNND